MSQMAHVCVIDLAPDEPSHRAADKNVGREMLLRRDTRCADQCGQTVGDHTDDRLVLVFVTDQRCEGPDLNGMTRGERPSAAPKITRLAFVGAVATKGLFQHSGDDKRVQKGLRAEDANLACLRAVGQDAEAVIAGDERDRSVGGTDLRNASSPFDLALAVFERICDATIGNDQPSGHNSGKQPPFCIVAIHAKWAGKDFLLVEENVK